MSDEHILQNLKCDQQGHYILGCYVYTFKYFCIFFVTGVLEIH